MEELLNTKTGIAGLLASICVVMSLHLIAKVGEFLWKIKERKDQVSEQGITRLSEVVQKNTTATENLEHRLCELESMLSEIPKFKTDLRRLFSAVKIISGDKWKMIRQEIMEEMEG